MLFRSIIKEMIISSQTVRPICCILPFIRFQACSTYSPSQLKTHQVQNSTGNVYQQSYRIYCQNHLVTFQLRYLLYSASHTHGDGSNCAAGPASPAGHPALYHLAYDRQVANRCHGMADHVELALYLLHPHQYSRQPQEA